MKIRLFFSQLRRNLFDQRINHQIFNRIFPHLRGEKNHGFAFSNREEMVEQTEKLELQELLDGIERQVKRMPAAYGESFRHIMHRDLQERLSMYQQVAIAAKNPCRFRPSAPCSAIHSITAYFPRRENYTKASMCR